MDGQMDGWMDEAVSGSFREVDTMAMENATVYCP